jgi:hypothetical protein
MSDHYNDERETWLNAMKAKGHSPVMDSDGLDVLATEYGDHHNGPACSVCGWGCCWHCETIDDIPECDVIEATVAPASIGAEGDR